MKNQIKQAIQILQQGGIIIYPTDTVYGIGCRMDNEASVKKLFRIRKRPQTQAVALLVTNQTMAQNYLLPIPNEVQVSLIKRYWPGGLTIILPCQTDKVLPLIRGKRDTLGVRMPNHPITLALIKGVGVPLLGPSANFHGEQTPCAFEELNPELMKLADFVIKGDCGQKEASTVIDCSVNPWKILREGAVKIKIKN